MDFGRFLHVAHSLCLSVALVAIVAIVARQFSLCLTYKWPLKVRQSI